MNAKVKRLWLKALRSGKYKQAQGMLRISNAGDDKPAFCCLGVLCDLYRRRHDDATWNDRVFIDGSGLDSASSLTPQVIEWAELHSADPVLGRTLRASELNDRGKSFAYIADRIEKYL